MPEQCTRRKALVRVSSSTCINRRRPRSRRGCKAGHLRPSSSSSGDISQEGRGIPLAVDTERRPHGSLIRADDMHDALMGHGDGILYDCMSRSWLAILSPLLSPFFYDLSISSYASISAAEIKAFFGANGVISCKGPYPPFTYNQPAYLSLFVPCRHWMTSTITVHLLRNRTIHNAKQRFSHHSLTIPHYTPHTLSLTSLKQAQTAFFASFAFLQNAFSCTHIGKGFFCFFNLPSPVPAGIYTILVFGSVMHALRSNPNRSNLNRSNPNSIRSNPIQFKSVLCVLFSFL